VRYQNRTAAGNSLTSPVALTGFVREAYRLFGGKVSTAEGETVS